MLSIANIVMFLKRFALQRSEFGMGTHCHYVRGWENFIGVMGCGIEDRIQPLKLWKFPLFLHFTSESHLIKPNSKCPYYWKEWLREIVWSVFSKTKSLPHVYLHLFLFSIFGYINRFASNFDRFNNMLVSMFEIILLLICWNGQN